MLLSLFFGLSLKFVNSSRVSDVNLDDEQITKLATLGGGGNNVATVEILQKSLLLRNL